MNLATVLARDPSGDGAHGGDVGPEATLRRRYNLAEKTLQCQSRTVQALREALRARDAKHAEEKVRPDGRIPALRLATTNIPQPCTATHTRVEERLRDCC